MRTTITLPQKHCRNQADHLTHAVETFVRGAGDRLHLVQYRCPGRHTPSLHRMPGTKPAQPSDPFAGIDENTESDARRPAVS